MNGLLLLILTININIYKESYKNLKNLFDPRQNGIWKYYRNNNNIKIESMNHNYIHEYNILET